LSPRAAWRLEELGFAEVYDYSGGKADWAAAGLPTEGTEAARTKAIDVARRVVATASPDEALGDVRERIAATGMQLLVVTNDDGIVLGLLREKELTAASDDVRVDAVMRPGPSTFRPNVTIERMAQYMTEHKLESSPITSSDGRLLGVLLAADAVAAANAK